MEWNVKIGKKVKQELEINYSDPIYCEICGNWIDEDIKYCNDCGEFVCGTKEREE